MKEIFFILLLFVLNACDSKINNSNSSNLELSDSISIEKQENVKNSNVETKIRIDFTENKNLLDIIILLPNNAFPSWEWKLDDRIKWYNQIKENNYYIDDNPDYFNQQYFEPDKAGFSIVDGFWSIKIYKTTENSFIVITNDIVGDGNSLNFYEVKSNRIKEYLDEKNIFSDFREQLKRKENSINCTEEFDELNDPIFNYNFINNKVEIESSWYLTKENYENCLIGNSIIYIFNPKTKKFDIEKTYWKTKKSD